MNPKFKVSQILLFSLVLMKGGGVPPLMASPAAEGRKAGQEAWALLEKNNCGAAVPLFEKALEGKSSRREKTSWWTGLGRCQESLGHSQAALTAFQEAQNLSPEGLEPTLDLARAYDKVDLHGSAISLYEKALKKNRTRQDIRFVLARCYYRAGELDKAQENVMLCLSAQPQDEESQRLLARILEGNGELLTAARQWESLLAQRPHGPSYVHLGHLWLRQGEWDLAEAAFQKAQGEGDRSPSLYFLWGAVEWVRGEREKARKTFSALLEKSPDYFPARFLLAVVNQEDKNTARAQQELARLKKGTTPEGIEEMVKAMKKSWGKTP